MDVKARRESATSGQAIAGAQSPAPDVGGQRASDSQKRRKSAVSIEIYDEFPRASHCVFGVARKARIVPPTAIHWSNRN
jgi:hypothetical protein